MKRRILKDLQWLLPYLALLAAIVATAVYRNAELLVNAKESTISIRQQYGAYIDEAAEQYCISPELIESIIEHESAGISNAVSSGGDIGLMQVNPRWHYDRMDKLGVKDLTDPHGNILVAVDYLAELFEKYGDLPMVLMVYNGTSDAEERWENGCYTDYALSVMERSTELERERGK